jgi:AraC family transcriptional regulator
MNRDPDFLAEVLAYIDAHLFEPMTMPELARVAGFSPFHFSRLFLARFGVTVMHYVRTCRLQAAAVRLSGDAPPPLIELALDCGFESQEAFTRAFRRCFGAPPGRYRREAPPPSLEEIVMTTAQVEKLPEIVHRDTFTVAGIRAIFDEHNKNGIPALWPRLVRALPLPGQRGEISYGVCSMTENGLNYVAGVETAADAALPDGFERIVLAAQDYAVFRITLDGSPLHPLIQSAMAEIWGRQLPQSGLKTVRAPDLEVYPADFEPMRKGSTLDYHVAIEHSP